MTAVLPRPEQGPGAQPAAEPPSASRWGLPSAAAVAVGRLAGSLSRRTGRGRGSTLPGRVALRLQPELLRRLAAGRTLVLVSGTNGKSTTSRYLAAALSTRGRVLTNEAGSNMRGGLATTLMSARSPAVPVVLETDEQVLATSVGELAPRVVVLLNLTRDQLDRTGEVTGHVRAWAAALRQVPRAVVVANADDPLVCAAVLAARPDGADVRWVAAGQPWRRDCPLCPVCGAAWSGGEQEWACGQCGFARPHPAWRLVDDRLQAPAAPGVRLQLALPGRANLANAAMALAAAWELGTPLEAASAAVQTVSEIGGRYRTHDHEGRTVRLLLAKNPAGWAEVLTQLTDGDEELVVAVNARGADGADTSWLWDVPFEPLRGRAVVAAGEHSADVSLRLLYAGITHTREPDPLCALRHLPGRSVTVVANYTAFAEVRDRLGARDPGPGRLRRAA